MNRRLITIAVIIGTFILMPTIACAGDLDDLKAVVNNGLEGWNTLNAAKYVEGLHGNAVVAGIASPFFVVRTGKEATRASLTAMLANNEILLATPINIEYKIIENVGLVFGNFSTVSKVKDGPIRVDYSRALFVYTKVKGKWQAVASSIAPISVGSSN